MFVKVGVIGIASVFFLIFKFKQVNKPLIFFRESFFLVFVHFAFKSKGFMTVDKFINLFFERKLLFM
jgi:hypothetical protein